MWLDTHIVYSSFPVNFRWVYRVSTHGIHGPQDFQCDCPEPSSVPTGYARRTGIFSPEISRIFIAHDNLAACFGIFLVELFWKTMVESNGCCSTWIFSTAAQLDISSCRSGNGWECAVGYVGEVLHTCSTDVMALVFTKWWKMEMENWWNWKNNTGLQNRDIPYVDLLEPNPYVWITEITVEVADCCWLRSIAQFWNVETVWQEWPSHPMNITFLSHHHPIIIWFSPSITMYSRFFPSYKPPFGAGISYSCCMANTPQRHATAVTGQRISEASCNMQVQLSGCEELQPCEVPPLKKSCAVEKKWWWWWWWWVILSFTTVL